MSTKTKTPVHSIFIRPEGYNKNCKVIGFSLTSLCHTNPQPPRLLASLILESEKENNLRFKQRQKKDKTDFMENWMRPRARCTWEVHKTFGPLNFWIFGQSIIYLDIILVHTTKVCHLVKRWVNSDCLNECSRWKKSKDD